MIQYRNHFVAIRNTRASAALGDLALALMTDQFGR